ILLSSLIPYTTLFRSSRATVGSMPWLSCPPSASPLIFSRIRWYLRSSIAAPFKKKANHLVGFFDFYSLASPSAHLAKRRMTTFRSEEHTSELQSRENL